MDSFFALDSVRTNLEYKLMRKTCMAYMLYAFFFVVFCLAMVAVPQSRQTHAAYLLAKQEAGVDDIVSMETMMGANQWVGNIGAIKDALPEFCPDCIVTSHSNDQGLTGGDVSEAFSWRGLKPAVRTLPRNVTYDFDQMLRPIDTLDITRGGFILFVEYSCQPLSTNQENKDKMSTVLVKCAEIYPSFAPAADHALYLGMYIAFYAIRVGVLLGTFFDWITDKRRERREDNERHKAFGTTQEENTFEFFLRGVVENITVSFVLNMIGIILPGMAFLQLSESPSEFKNILGTNLYIICAQVFIYGRFWSPFTVIVETMQAAKWQLYNFMITLLTAFFVFAVNAHIMFGTFEEGYSSLFSSAVTVFGHVLDPMDASDLTEHNPSGSLSFWLITNITFILIMSQFLIAVLCGSFDTVRDEIDANARDAAIPEGFSHITVVDMAERSDNFFCNNFLSWNHKICGVQTQIVVEICRKLKKEETEIATAQQIHDSLKLRGITEISVANDLMRKLGVKKSEGHENDNLADLKDTAQGYRDEIAEALEEAMKKMGELTALQEKADEERKN